MFGRQCGPGLAGFHQLTYDGASASMAESLMNKPFLIPTEFRRNRLFPQSASPKRYISLMLLSAFLAGAALLLVPRTVQLQIENKSLSERSTALESTLKAVESEKRREIGRDEKEKENLREAIENYKREQESISFELKKTKDHLDALTEEKSYLEEILINKTKEVEATKQRSPMPYSAVSTATNIGSDLAQKLKDKDEEIRKLYDQNKILSEKLERLYQTANSKMAEINVAKIALEDTISEARQTIDNEWNLPAGQAGTVNLGSIQATQGN